MTENITSSKHYKFGKEWIIYHYEFFAKLLRAYLKDTYPFLCDFVIKVTFKG